MKKLSPIAVILIMVTLLSMPLTALAAGSQSITRTFQPTTDAAQPGGDDDGFETNPSYAYDDDGLGSAVDDNSGDNDNIVADGIGTDKHNYYDYGMAEIPDGSTINGITVRADIAVDSLTNEPFTAIRLSWQGGTSWTDPVKSYTLSNIAETTYTYGGTGDAWGRTWLVSELSNANFRVQVINGDTKLQNSLRIFSLDYIAVSITFTPIWDSYRDSGRTTVWGDDAGTQYDATYHIVYMKGTGFLDGAQTYTVSYYDSDGTKRATNAGIALVNPNGRGTLGNTSDPYEPNYDLLNPPAAAGTWNAVVQPYEATNAFPTDYSTLSADPDYYELLANDTFIVDASAIPEFSTVISAMAVAGLCFGIYYWMRKRYRRQAAMAELVS